MLVILSKIPLIIGREDIIKTVTILLNELNALPNCIANAQENINIECKKPSGKIPQEALTNLDVVIRTYELVKQELAKFK